MVRFRGHEGVRVSYICVQVAVCAPNAYSDVKLIASMQVLVCGSNDLDRIGTIIYRGLQLWSSLDSTFVSIDGLVVLAE